MNPFANFFIIRSQFSLRQRARSCYWCFKIGEEVILLRYAYGTWRRSFENNSVYFNVATVSIVMFLRSTPFWDIKDTLDIFSFFFFMTVQVGFRKSVKNGILTRISIAVLWNRARLSYSREPRRRREANLLEGDFLVLNPWNYKRFFTWESRCFDNEAFSYVLECFWGTKISRLTTK